MLYRFLRWAAHIALRWYYADVVVQGAERVPTRRPLLLVANHPNALVDALLVGTALRRRVLLTAKATLFEHPVLAPILRQVGVVPLRRAADERAAAPRDGVSVARNADAFHAVRAALQREGAVLVFPEGISHDRPELAPLKTGAARMALDATSAGIRGVAILPIGLVYERKEALGSRVLVRIGHPIDVDHWSADVATSNAASLTTRIDDALRLVTLNFASDDRAERAVTLARALAGIASTPPSLVRPPSLDIEVEIIGRIERTTQGLATAAPDLLSRADQFMARLAALEHRLATHHITLAEVRISPQVNHGTYFVLREGGLAILALPAAVLGRITHWLPLRVARMIAMRPTEHAPSRDQPAMRTIVLGMALLLLSYAVQGAVVTHWLGVFPAISWLVIIFFAARIDVALHTRVRRAVGRAGTYLALRRNSALRTSVLEEVDALLAEALALERELVAT